LGILHVGEETAENLAQYFHDVKNLKKASVEELEKLPDVGQIVAREIYEWFHDETNLNFIERLLSRGIKIKKVGHTGTKLKGMTFVFTGTLEGITRPEAEKKVRMLGGNPSGSVSASTDYVVAGENPGSKYEKAKELGVKIISEKEFLYIIG